MPHLPGRVCLFLYFVQHQLLARGVRCALHLRLGGDFAPWQFSLIFLAISIPLCLPESLVDRFFSLGLG